MTRVIVIKYSNSAAGTIIQLDDGDYHFAVMLGNDIVAEGIMPTEEQARKVARRYAYDAMSEYCAGIKPEYKVVSPDE